MTPEEKAKELIKKFGHAIRFDETIEGYFVNMHSVKECALIAVEEILKEIEDIDDGQTFIPYEYWNEVKHEINQL